MNGLSGEKAKNFVRWLNQAHRVLPPKMTLTEAQELFERKLEQEKEILNART